MLQQLIDKINLTADKEVRRTKFGILSGVLGLSSNLLLFAMKFLIGIMAHSVSIMADAINNLTDAASAIVTLVGFHIAAKPADKEHPYGHERFEYISGLVISFIITFVGFQFLITSFKKILQPESVRLSWLLFVILILSIGIKLWQSRMYRKMAKTINSSTLRASAQDSLNDVITTTAVLLSAVIEYFTKWQIDGWMGLLIAGYILFNGIQMIRSFVAELLGSRPNNEEIQAMEERLTSYQSILGYHDLLVHNYGPQKRFASVHIEVDEDWSLNHAHEVIDTIEKDFRQNLGVELVCHLDPVAISNGHYRRLRQQVKGILQRIDPQLSLHDFRIEEGGGLSFDVVVPASIYLSDEVIRQRLQANLRPLIGDHRLVVTFDHNYLL